MCYPPARVYADVLHPLPARVCADVLPPAHVCADVLPSCTCVC